MNDAGPGQVAPDHGSGELPTYDDAVLIDMLAGDARLAAEIIGEFAAALPGGVDQMAAAFVGGRTNDLTAAAHRLKSSSRTVGAMRLGELCERLEAGARDGSSDAVRRLIDAVTAESDAVIQRLNQARPVNTR
jgi:HPt (histidine-containing phosphotransfer) domain-containing protein